MKNKIPTAEELLKNNFLLIENDKTCEAHTSLVVKQMQEFAKLHVRNFCVLNKVDVDKFINYEKEIK